MQPLFLSGDYRPRLARRPRGMVLMVFLVCLAVAAALMVGTAKIAMTAHQATQTASWSVQARLLAESGVERAVAKLAADPAYTGEIWPLPAAELGEQEGAVVRIEVKPVAGEEKRRTIKIEADYPDDPLHHARSEKEILMELP